MNAQELITRVFSAIVSHPEAVEVERRFQFSAVRWVARVHLDDHGRAVGIYGSHVKALSLLVEVAGEVGGASWNLWLDAPKPLDRGPKKAVPTPPATAYDPAPAAALLEGVLETLAINATAEVSPIAIPVEVRGRPSAPRLGFVFRLRPATRADEDLLRDLRGEDPTRKLSIEQALGALWRAWGRQAGIYFTVTVE